MHDTKSTLLKEKIQQPNIFQETTADFLEFVAEHHTCKRPSFLIPTKCLSQEAGIAGELFHNISNRQSYKKKLFHTFFANSQYEALIGTIKIMRANAKDTKKKIAIYESKPHYSFLTNPLQLESSSPMTPGVVFVSSRDSVIELLNQQALSGLVFHAHIQSDFTLAHEVFHECAKLGICSALSRAQHLECNPELLPLFEHSPDIFIYGESFAHFQVPFGCFSMSEKAYKPWNTIQDCLTHSSTYGGNIVTLGYVIKHIYRQFSDIDRLYIHSYQEIVDKFESFVNPKAALIYKSLHLAPNVATAEGSWLETKGKKGQKRKILDCLGNSGCSLRGHNPSDFVNHVIKKYNTKTDYIEDLGSALFSLTKLPHMIMATSGAHAVDLALYLAQSAIRAPLKILSFINNYAGKTLGALSVTHFQGYRDGFGPFFSDVYFFDPFKENAKEKLIELIEKVQVNFAWFELLQGDSLQEIPTSIIQILKQYQKKSQILIGVDEILTGCFRTGPFLLCEAFDLHPDIVTLSKGLSDLSFPFGCVLTSESIPDGPHMQELKSLYANPFGASVALNALKSALEKQLNDRVASSSSSLRKELNRICSKHSWITSVKGRGLLLYLEPNEKKFPINLIGKDLFGFIFSSYLMQNSRVFLFNCRLTPSLLIEASEREFLIKELDRALNKLNIFRILSITFRSFFQTYLKSLLQQIKGSLKFLR